MGRTQPPTTRERQSTRSAHPGRGGSARKAVGHTCTASCSRTCLSPHSGVPRTIARSSFKPPSGISSNWPCRSRHGGAVQLCGAQVGRVSRVAKSGGVLYIQLSVAASLFPGSPAADTPDAVCMVCWIQATPRSRRCWGAWEEAPVHTVTEFTLSATARAREAQPPELRI